MRVLVASKQGGGTPVVLYNLTRSLDPQRRTPCSRSIQLTLSKIVKNGWPGATNGASWMDGHELKDPKAERVYPTVQCDHHPC